MCSCHIQLSCLRRQAFPNFSVSLCWRDTGSWEASCVMQGGNYGGLWQGGGEVNLHSSPGYKLCSAVGSMHDVFSGLCILSASSPGTAWERCPCNMSACCVTWASPPQCYGNLPFSVRAGSPLHRASDLKKHSREGWRLV